MALRIVFMGTPDFAVPCLGQLLEDGHEVPVVYSQPDKPRGRGHRLAPTPVKEFALERGIPVEQPVKLRDGTVAERLRALAPDLAVVVAYGRLLPLDILEIPRLGCINVHASLLPRLRGAAPIQWSVLNGDTVTGVTTMYLAEGMDTGDMILTRETPIGEEETSGELFVRLSALGAECLSETVALLEQGKAPRIPQDHGLATAAPPITKELCPLDFTWTAREICCRVRGLAPSPSAHFLWEGGRVKVHKARPAPGLSGEPGTVLDPKRFLVACGDGAVELAQVQPEGKRPMEGGAFACGRRMERGQKLT